MLSYYPSTIRVQRACGRIVYYWGDTYYDACVTVDGVVSRRLGEEPFYHVLVEPLSDCHSHVLDYAIAEMGEDLSLKDLVSRSVGLKYRALAGMDPRVVAERLTRTPKLHSMARVYLELWPRSRELLGAVRSVARQVIVYVQPVEMSVRVLVEALRSGLGIGLDTVYDLGSSDARRVSSEAAPGMIQVHVSETRSLAEARDYERLEDYKGCIAVHANYLPAGEEWRLLDYCSGLVVCPSSELMFSGRLIDARILSRLYEEGLPIALGVDNYAWNPVSILAQASLAYMVFRPYFPKPREELARMLFEAITTSCWRMPPSRKPERGRALIGLKLPEVMWSSSPLVTIVKRGAYAAYTVLEVA